MILVTLVPGGAPVTKSKTYNLDNELKTVPGSFLFDHLAQFAADFVIQVLITTQLPPNYYSIITQLLLNNHSITTQLSLNYHPITTQLSLNYYSITTQLPPNYYSTTTQLPLNFGFLNHL